MRKQSSTALAYFFRYFFQYIYIVLPVALVMGFFANMSGESNFLLNWVGGNLATESYMEDMAKAFFLVNQAQEWWQFVIIFFLLAVTFSLLVVKVSRHMRIGAFVTFPIKSALKVIPSMLIYCACFTLLAQLFEFVAFGIAYGLSTFIPMNVVIICALVLIVGTKVGVVYLWMLTICSFPLYYSENSRFNVALSYSIREMSKRTWYCLGHALLYAGAHVLLVLLGCFLPQIVVNIVYTLFFIFVIYYVPCAGFTTHHQSLGSERKDITVMIIG